MTQSASPSLSHFLRQAALDVPHPTSPERTLWDARFDTGPYAGETVDSESLGATYTFNAMADSVGVSPLGSGSDYTSVLFRLI
jgi:N-acetylated-alpha-linked acidic dipeptidase